MSNETTEVAEPSAKKVWADESWAFLVLRLWLAARASITGLQKFAGTNEAGEKTYGTSYYMAIPDAMKEAFSAQPLLPDFLSKPFYAALGYGLIAVGLMLLVGLGTRIFAALMLAGVAGFLAFFRFGPFSPFLEGHFGFYGDRDVFLAVLCLLLVLLGAGGWSVDANMRRRRKSAAKPE